MSDYKNEIASKICYTEMVYVRINKKLRLSLSNTQIETMVLAIIAETDESNFQKIGKNIYIFNASKKIKLTNNSFTNRIITADIINED